MNRRLALNSTSSHEALPLQMLAPVVIVAPHPDDETLGCGGLIAHCADLRIELTVVSVTDGEASHPASDAWPPARLGELRRREQDQALRELGLDSPCVNRMGLPDGGTERLEPATLATARSRLSSWLTPARSVFVTAPDDDHPDHRSAARLVRGCTEARVFFYEVWPPDGRAPLDADGADWGLDVRTVRLRKRAALNRYASQRGLGGHDQPGFALPRALLQRALGPVEYYRESLFVTAPPAHA